MQIRSKRERVLIVLCIVIVLASLLLVATPSGKPVPVRKLLPTETAQTEWRKKRRTYEQRVADLVSMQPRIERMTYMEAADTAAALAMQDLQQIEKRAHVHLRVMNPLRAEKMPSGLLMRVPVEVRFKAAFQPDVMRFLYYVEDPKGRIVVDKVDITSSDSRFKTVDVSARVSVFTQSVSGDAATGEGDTNDG